MRIVLYLLLIPLSFATVNASELQLGAQLGIDVLKQNFTNKEAENHIVRPEVSGFGITIAQEFASGTSYEMELLPLEIAKWEDNQSVDQKTFIDTYLFTWKTPHKGFSVNFGRQFEPSHRIDTPSPTFGDESPGARYEGFILGYESADLMGMNAQVFFAPGMEGLTGSEFPDQEWAFGFSSTFEPTKDLGLFVGLTRDSDIGSMGDVAKPSREKFPSTTVTFSTQFKGVEKTFVGFGLYYNMNELSVLNAEKKKFESKEGSNMNWFVSANYQIADPAKIGLDIVGSTVKTPGSKKDLTGMTSILSGSYEAAEKLVFAADLSFITQKFDGKSVLTKADSTDTVDSHTAFLLRMTYAY